MTDKNKLLITPNTRVGDLLDAYPELETILIEIAPPFKKLRNPILRRTVARVTSLSQAARVGGVSVVEMVRTLRRAVGQPEFVEDVATASQYPIEPPEWMQKERVVKVLDVRPMIEAGEQPIGAVLQEIAALKPSQVLEVIAPFEPAPLIDKAIQRGVRVWVKTDSGKQVHTYFAPPA